MRILAGQPVNPQKIGSISSGQTAFLDLTFVNASGVAEAPTSLRWRLDNLSRQKQVQDWAAIADPEAEETIVISNVLNTLEQNSRWLDRQLLQATVEATFDDGSVTPKIFCYEVADLWRPGS